MRAAPLLALLFPAAVALAVTSVSVAILTAANRPGVVSLIGTGVLAAAIAGHLILIPLWGPLGAATVTAVTGTVGALVALALVHRTWRVHAYATALRAVLLAVPAYAIASAIATPTTWGLVVKLTLLSAGVAGAFLALGELDRDETTRLWTALQSKRLTNAKVG